MNNSWENGWAFYKSAGIDADLLAACLDAAEKIVAEPEFNRWPTVPVRGYGK